MLPKPTAEWDDDKLLAALESVLLAAGGAVSLSSLSHALELPVRRVRDLLQEGMSRRSGGIRIQLDRDLAQLVTAPEFAEVVHRFLGTSKPPVLGRSALETLTVVAYRQPITRPELEAIRGANSDRAVQTLLARGLIEERGTRMTLGRPTEYGTTFGFLEYFGLSSLAELPPLPEQAENVPTLQDIGMRPDATHEKGADG